MENKHSRKSSYIGTPIRLYRYAPSGKIVQNYTNSEGLPVFPMKYRELSSNRSNHSEATRRPASNPRSTPEVVLKPKLLLDINTREVYVMQNGSSLAQGLIIPGFYYKFELNKNFERKSHIEEMKIFFAECKKIFTSKFDFKFLFSSNGKILRCLHELHPDEKIVLVSQDPEHLGVRHGTPEVLKSSKKSPLYKSFYEHPDSSKIVENINNCFKVSSSRSRNKRIHKKQANSISHPREVKFSFDQLKIKLGCSSYEIDKGFPTLFNQGIEKLKEKCKFSKKELHSLYGKFKLLVLLSCGVDTKHDIKKGVNKKTFIEYYAKNKEMAQVMSKIFDKFDVDGGGSVSWEEYLKAMDVIWNGTVEDQVDFFFSVYDSDGNGSLSFKEIQNLCKLQLQMSHADDLIEDLSYSFASLIFDLTETKYDEDIPAYKMKEIISKQKDKSLVEMFCSFNFLK